MTMGFLGEIAFDIGYVFMKDGPAYHVFARRQGSPSYVTLISIVPCMLVACVQVLRNPSTSTKSVPHILLGREGGKFFRPSRTRSVVGKSITKLTSKPDVPC